MGVNIEKPVGLTISHGSLTERADIRCAACQDRVRVVVDGDERIRVSYSDPCSFVLSLFSRFTLLAFCFFAFLNISLHGSRVRRGIRFGQLKPAYTPVSNQDQLSISLCS